jgi:hypothetical protein
MLRYGSWNSVSAGEGPGEFGNGSGMKWEFPSAALPRASFCSQGHAQKQDSFRYQVDRHIGDKAKRMSEPSITGGVLKGGRIHRRIERGRSFARSDTKNLAVPNSSRVNTADWLSPWRPVKIQPHARTYTYGLVTGHVEFWVCRFGLVGWAHRYLIRTCIKRTIFFDTYMMTGYSVNLSLASVDIVTAQCY